MKPRNIVIGQKVSPEKIKRAKELRKDMTPAKKVLWEYLRAKRFNGLKFRRQQIIEGFIVDFYCHSLGLVIKVDGEIYDTQQIYDRNRENILSNKNLQIIRFTNEQVVNNIEAVLQAIAEKTEGLRDLR